MNNGLSFRPARTTDFDAVLDLARQLASHIETDDPPLTVAQFERYYVNPDGPMHLLLALREERVVGMISWTLTHELYSADTRVYISDVSIDHAARGQGVGAALMNQVRLWARLNHASKIAWEVWHRNFSAMAFYEKLGASVDDEAMSYVLRLEDSISDSN